MTWLVDHWKLIEQSRSAVAALSDDEHRPVTERKHSVYVPISIEIGFDAGWWPWLAPDPNPMPHIDLLPRATALAAAARDARRRIRAAAHVLTHGPTEETTP